MFKIFKNVIENSDFDLRDILKKIEESYIKYVCKLDNCVWSPAEYPVAWEEVI